MFIPTKNDKTTPSGSEVNIIILNMYGIQIVLETISSQLSTIQIKRENLILNSEPIA